MAFCFKRKQSVAKAVRRLGRTRIEAALGCLADCRQTEAIHSVRKEIKKVRAVLRLIRGRISNKDYRRLNKELRKAAGHLSVVRDAHVRSETLNELTVHFRSQLGPRSLRHLRAVLRADLQAERRQFLQDRTVDAVERLLRRAADEFEGLSVSGGGWRALRPAVKTTYRRGRRAYRAVLQDSTTESLHEWRKRVKDLWYYACMLSPIWSEQMEAVANELEILGDTLGDDHDLFLLQQSLQSTQAIARKEQETLGGLIRQRQNELRKKALTMGTRFYGEKPSAFSNRLGRYWKAWRKGKGDSFERHFAFQRDR